MWSTVKARTWLCSGVMGVAMEDSILLVGV